ncbi:MAG: tRNA (adenosine(37)-N6)-threonylcarbamoyltransferase complex ATPase subunit type 1 TsaE [Pseudomonadota bacterium]
MRLELFLPDSAATEALGARLAPLVAPGDVVCLRGGLGAGKTTLTRGLISALMGAPTDVPSPTFTLVQTYETRRSLIWHFDLYRLEEDARAPGGGLEELGWDDTHTGIALVEWPDRAPAQMPPHRLDITLEPTAGARYAALEPKGEDWQDRLHGF